tara:strand:+ start:145 stop:327 length:183 start_codon:yes stop_codon:yes gene_type:complete
MGLALLQSNQIVRLSHQGGLLMQTARIYQADRRVKLVRVVTEAFVIILGEPIVLGSFMEI